MNQRSANSYQRLVESREEGQGDKGTREQGAGSREQGDKETRETRKNNYK
jgi:hypothetical protein